VKRPLLPILLALAALGLAPAAAVQAASPSDVHLTACGTSLEQPLRNMAVEGRMRLVSGARKLQMRFDLQVLTPDRPRWTAVVAPGFGVWNTADPTPKRYVFEKRVEALAAPARYRMVVRFRWLGAGDRRVASAKQVSPTCAQPDLRPDLAPVRLLIGRNQDRGGRRYVVTVANTGGSTSGAFDVTVQVGGVLIAPPVALTGVRVDGRSELVLSGPACPEGARVTVRVDPRNAVAEGDEADNRLTRACPGA
jgi:hypothetical protein